MVPPTLLSSQRQAPPPQGFSLFSAETPPRKSHCFDSLIAKDRGTKQAKSNVLLSTVGGLYPGTVSQSKPLRPKVPLSVFITATAM